MSQAEVTKLTQYGVIGSPADNIAASKLTMYVLLTPGSDPSAPPAERQGFVYGQRIRRG